MTSTNQLSVWPAPVERPEALVSRVLIIGLDGATWTLLNPAMAAGYMPRLSALVETGTRGTLLSTIPPITPAAWTTFLTGKGPGKHGIIDFVRYNARDHRLAFNSTQAVGEKSLWTILSEQGLHVGSIQVPMTYPPYPVNGFLISGFETPGLESEFCYPPTLKPGLLAAVPDYGYKSDWHKSHGDDDATFEKNMAFVGHSFLQMADVLKHCTAEHPWDAAMVVLKMVDNASHKAWAQLDPLTADRWPARKDVCARMWRQLDGAIGLMIDMARARDPQTAILMMSDHGHGSLDARVYANRLLERGGFLKQKSLLSRWSAHLSDQLSRWTLEKGRFNKDPMEKLARELPVDWPRTPACVMHAEIDGFLYLNVKGRQPPEVACVEPQDYDRVREEVRDYLLRCKDELGQPIFVAVHRTEELYGCDKSRLGELPDLILVPQPGSVVVRKVRGGRMIRRGGALQWGGTHRPEGVFVANGPAIRKGGQLDAHISDLTPTVLGLLGLGVPQDMTGKFLTALFDRPVTPKYVDESAPASRPQEAQPVFTPEEEVVLHQRLSDLGYLE